ncbi:MAG: CopG family transcriptional regulator [Armatimonadetes bacterium]|nr:CopG family transcriptional regulator [Armatimonadota bacterium]
MRTTLDIDEDVLQAARELAASRKSTVGRVLSDLARQALQPKREKRTMRNGLPLFPPRGDARVVTMDAVNRLRDALDSDLA